MIDYRKKCTKNRSFHPSSGSHNNSGNPGNGAPSGNNMSSGNGQSGPMGNSPLNSSPNNILKRMLNALYGTGMFNQNAAPNGLPAPGPQNGQQNANYGQNAQNMQSANNPQNANNAQNVNNVNNANNANNTQNPQNTQNRPQATQPVMKPAKPFMDIIREYKANYTTDTVIRIDAALNNNSVHAYYLRGHANFPDQYNLTCDGPASNTVSLRLNPYYICDGFWMGAYAGDLDIEFTGGIIAGYAFI